MIWTHRNPGDPLFGAQVVDQDLDQPRGGTILFGDLTPDVVRTPDDLPIAGWAGREVRVAGRERRPCPAEGHDHEVLWWDLVAPLVVAECPTAGFLWLGKRES